MPEEIPQAASWNGEDGGGAPPPFVAGAGVAVPIDAERLDLFIEADAANRRAAGRALMRFRLSQPGRPILDMVPRPQRLALDGEELPPERLRLVLPPDESTPLRVLDKELDAGASHELVIEYELPEATVQFGGGGVRLGLFMTDLNQRGYLERHAPANLEFDQLPLNLEVRVTGSGHAHRLFTNGRPEQLDGDAWRVSFPDYFTCSSYFLHLTDRPLTVRERSFNGEEREINVTAYGEDPAEVEQAAEEALGFMKELEGTFGPYTHDSLLVYCTGDISGGMEYAGATMTSLHALGHELTHSWFARGVMPANGNAGWIDEAIATWRGQGYPTASGLTTRPPVNLAGFSPYRRHTPMESYYYGALLLSELDRLFSPGGLRPHLKRLFAERKRRSITTPYFQSFLEHHTGVSLGAIFDRYVYGKDEGGGPHPDEADLSRAAPFDAAGIATPAPPPRAFTAGELLSLL